MRTISILVCIYVCTELLVMDTIPEGGVNEVVLIDRQLGFLGFLGNLPNYQKHLIYINTFSIILLLLSSINF